MIENKLHDEIARKSGIQDTKQSLLSEINRQSRERRLSRSLTDYKKYITKAQCVYTYS
jgi:hypothetical protein